MLAWFGIKLILKESSIKQINLHIQEYYNDCLSCFLNRYCNNKVRTLCYKVVVLYLDKKPHRKGFVIMTFRKLVRSILHILVLTLMQTGRSYSQSGMVKFRNFQLLQSLDISQNNCTKQCNTGHKPSPTVCNLCKVSLGICLVIATSSHTTERQCLMSATKEIGVFEKNFDIQFSGSSSVSIFNLVLTYTYSLL